MEVATPLVIGFVGSFFLLATLTLTSFVKISVVLMIVRNALGLQQVPSNMIVMALAFFLAVFVSMPVLSASVDAVADFGIELTTVEELAELWSRAIAPFQTFLEANIRPDHLDFFVGVTNEIWAGSGLVGSPDNIIVQIPSFMITELTEAFETGFLLYLPFVAVDLAVTGILMALGMQMVQPNILSTPLKLLLFVAVDGWSKLVEGLIVSYTV